jgi:8-oxo-dGTP diphosphatase
VKRFPTGEYGRQRLEFFPAPRKAQLRSFAALVFPWVDERVVVCDIVGRGWCIPSGRVEAVESSLQAVRREALEEAGIELGCVQYIGCYRITERGEVRWADCYTARVKRLAEIAMPEESLGRKIVSLGELPSIYHLWNDLTELVFKHAYDVLIRSEATVPPTKPSA